MHTNEEPTQVELPVTVAEDAAPAKNSRRNIIIGASAAAVLVLGGAAAFVIPKLVHDHRVDTYHELQAETTALLEKISENTARQDAAEGLFELSTREAGMLATALAETGKTSVPIILKADAAAVTDAATKLQEAVTGIEVGEELSENAIALEEAVKEARESDAEAVKQAEAEKKDPPAPSAPATWHETSVDDAAALAFPTDKTPTVGLVADASVTSETVTNAQSFLEEVTKNADTVKKQLAKKTADLDTLAAKVDAALSSLEGAAQHAPGQATKVAEAASKAGDTKKLTEAAAAAANPELSGFALKNAVDVYIAQAKAVQKAHADKEAKEAAEAAAAAAAAEGAAGYTDPGTGAYVPVEQGWGGGGGWADPGTTGGGWTGGGSTGGGSANTGGGSGSTGGGNTGGGGGGNTGGGGGGNGGGYTPPPHECPAPPAGWWWGGSTGNGCPIYLPPGGGDTEGW
ncbi:hypothetical protein [Leucobacter komagatae]